MPKSKRMSVEKRPRLSQDALFFLHKVFVPTTDRRVRQTLVDLLGKKLTRRALEASCELIEAGFIEVEEAEGIYKLLKPFPDPPLKLQRIREAYEAFDIFEPEISVKIPENYATATVALIAVMTDLSRIQTDVLRALGYKDPNDPVAQQHVRHAIQAIQRLNTEGVKGLETLLERN